MPEKEFELYLSLLGKLLRLSPEQTTSIERELRDHFEERFEALVRSGMPRDEAIRRTLDEFGDVAGLAHEFTHLSRRNIRRRIMQGTMATAGVAAAVVIYVTLFRGPEPAVGPGPNVVAQEQAEPADAAKPQAETPAAAITEGDIEWIDPGRFLPEKLAQPTDVQFSGTPLREVIDYIKELHDLNILLDAPTLTAEGITGDEEISVDMRATPVHAVLDVLLRNVNHVPLAWMPKSDVLMVTTRERANTTMSTQHYNVRDLLSAGYTHGALIDVVMNMTEGPWESNDGIGGSVAEFGDLLVVKQCERTQVDVACTLAGLRSKHREARVAELEQHAALHAVLDMQSEAYFSGTPLRDVIHFLHEVHNVPIFLDMPVVASEGITGDEEVSINVSGINLRSVFQLLLENVNDVPLDIVIRDGAIWVTTRAAAQQSLATVIHDVSDITASDPEQADKLVDVIKGQTQGPWEDIAGTGGVLDAPSPGRLACRQMLRAQDEVRAVLAAVRASLQASGGGRLGDNVESSSLETRFYRMDAEAAFDVAQLIPNVIEPGTWKLFPSAMGGMELNPAEIGTIHRMAAGRMLLKFQAGDLIEVTDKFPNYGPRHPENVAARKQAIDESDSRVAVIPLSVLIVTHKPAVLREISKLLESLLSGNESWSGHGAGDDKVKFITPGFQEGTWNGSLGGAGGPLPPAEANGGGGVSGGMGAAGFGGVGGGGFGGSGFFSVEPQPSL